MSLFSSNANSIAVETTAPYWRKPLSEGWRIFPQKCTDQKAAKKWLGWQRAKMIWWRADARERWRSSVVSQKQVSSRMKSGSLCYIPLCATFSLLSSCTQSFLLFPRRRLCFVGIKGHTKVAHSLVLFNFQVHIASFVSCLLDKMRSRIVYSTSCFSAKSCCKEQ